MKKLTTRELRRFILETVNESSKSTQRKAELKDIINRTNQLLEKADPNKMDPEKFPQKLSDVVAIADQATELSTSGVPDQDGAPADDDAIEYEDKAEIAGVQQLKPSQSSMNIAKALSFALGHIKSGTPGGHLGAFVSKDLFIMDGHHRWISSGMVDPEAKIGGYLVDFPGKELVAVLNNLTVGRFGYKKGKDATGGFDQFVEAPIRAQLEEYLENGSGSATDKEGNPNPFRLEGSDVQSLIEKFTGVQGDGAKEAAVKKFVENLSKLTLKTPDWAATREDMPIIEKEDSEEARAALAQGEINVNESKSPNTKMLLERWNKLAGIK